MTGRSWRLFVERVAFCSLVTSGFRRSSIRTNLIPFASFLSKVSHKAYEAGLLKALFCIQMVYPDSRRTFCENKRGTQASARVFHPPPPVCTFIALCHVVLCHILFAGRFLCLHSYEERTHDRLRALPTSYLRSKLRSNAWFKLSNLRQNRKGGLKRC